MSGKKYVAYYRVSTGKQEESGLGLEDQKQEVWKKIGRENIKAEFVEIETGKRSDRPKLQEAIEYAKENSCILVVHKMDRLGRKASHLFAIRDSGIDLLILDMPNMDTMSFGIYATFAQVEGEKISERTKAALRVKKAQGFQLGSPQNLTESGREKGHIARTVRAQNRKKNKDAYKIACDLKDSGLSLNRIARKLNEYGLSGVNGGKFHAVTVQKLFRLYS